MEMYQVEIPAGEYGLSAAFLKYWLERLYPGCGGSAENIRNHILAHATDRTQKGNERQAEADAAPDRTTITKWLNGTQKVTKYTDWLERMFLLSPEIENVCGGARAIIEALTFLQAKPSLLQDYSRSTHPDAPMHAVSYLECIQSLSAKSSSQENQQSAKADRNFQKTRENGHACKLRVISQRTKISILFISLLLFLGVWGAFNYHSAPVSVQNCNSVSIIGSENSVNLTSDNGC